MGGEYDYMNLGMKMAMGEIEKMFAGRRRNG